MSFEDTPEDAHQSFPCHCCENGSISNDANGNWRCDQCNWSDKNAGSGVALNASKVGS